MGEICFEQKMHWSVNQSLVNRDEKLMEHLDLDCLNVHWIEYKRNIKEKKVRVSFEEKTPWMMNISDRIPNGIIEFQYSYSQRATT